MQGDEDRYPGLDDPDARDFPDSVRDMMAGALGQPPDGWPSEVQSILLRGESPRAGRWGATLPPVDFDELEQWISANLGEG